MLRLITIPVAFLALAHTASVPLSAQAWAEYSANGEPSSFHPLVWDSVALLVFDGSGANETATIYVSSGKSIQRIGQVPTASGTLLKLHERVTAEAGRWLPAVTRTRERAFVSLQPNYASGIQRTEARGKVPGRYTITFNDSLKVAVTDIDAQRRVLLHLKRSMTPAANANDLKEKH